MSFASMKGQLAAVLLLWAAAATSVPRRVKIDGQRFVLAATGEQVTDVTAAAE